MLIATVLILLTDFPSMQIVLSLQLSLFNFVYITWFLPFDQPFLNVMEIFNEMSVFGTTIIISNFAGTLDDHIDFKYSMGWVFIAFLALNIMVQLFVITSISVYNLVKRFKNKICKKSD